MVYRARGLRALGISQFFIAMLMIVLAIASFASLDHWTTYIACGIWVGVWVGLTGLFAFLGAKSDHSPNNCMIGIMIGFAVTGCVFAGTMLIIYSFALAEFSYRLRCPQYIDYYDSYRQRHGHDYCNHHYYRADYPQSTAQAGAAIGSLLLVLAVLEFFVALASSIYGCNACCCIPTVQAQQQVAYVQQPGGTVMVINPHGGVPTGTTVQTISTYPGQVLPVIQTGQPQVQTFFTPPQGNPQQGLPMQPYHTYPGSAIAAGGASGEQRPRQAFQAPQRNQVELPPPYNCNG